MRLARRLVLVALVACPRLAAWGQAMPGMTPNSSTMDLDRQIRVFARADLLEYVPNGTGGVRADWLSWIGGDYNRLYLQLDGEQPFNGIGGETAVDVSYGRLLTPFWTGVIGGRVELRGLGSSRRSTRGLFAVGFEGLSPYFFQVEPTLYLSNEGQVSGRFTTSMDLLFTQRLILQPRLETNFSIQGVPELGIGAGLNDVELGARMRYEIRREFAPYLGLVWTRQTGATAGFARSAGEPTGRAGVVIGLRLWR